MIVRDKPNAFKLFFLVRGSVVPKILSKIIFITLLSGLIVVLQYWQPQLFIENKLTPFVLFGAGLSLFLGFRNNASYARWWEARQQLGQLVVESRSFARQVMSFIGLNSNKLERTTVDSTRQRLIYLAIAYHHALRHRLRDSNALAEMSPYLNESDKQRLEGAVNVPSMVLLMINETLGEQLKQHQLSDIMVQGINQHLVSIDAVQAACERIKNTPLPFAYMLLVQRTSYLYCVLLPFFLAPSLGVITPLVCAIVAYTFFGLDALSEELESPFTHSSNSLPLSALSRGIELDLLEILAEATQLKVLQPVDGRLD